MSFLKHQRPNHLKPRMPKVHFAFVFNFFLFLNLAKNLGVNLFFLFFLQLVWGTSLLEVDSTNFMLYELCLILHFLCLVRKIKAHMKKKLWENKHKINNWHLQIRILKSNWSYRSSHWNISLYDAVLQTNLREND